MLLIAGSGRVHLPSTAAAITYPRGVTTLPELQQLIEATRAERGFTTDPVRLLCLLVEEVGEVAAEVKKTWSDNYPDIQLEELGDELADVFVLLSALASSFGLDLDASVRSKFFGADSERDWATARRLDTSPSTDPTSA